MTQIETKRFGSYHPLLMQVSQAGDVIVYWAYPKGVCHQHNSHVPKEFSTSTDTNR